MSKEFITRVYHEDTDFLGVVYYANYFKFIERARSEAIRSVGIDQNELISEYGIHFVVLKVEAHFYKSARYDNLLLTETKIKFIRSASLILEQRVFLKENLVFSADVKLASVNGNGKPVKLPDFLKKNLLLI